MFFARREERKGQNYIVVAPVLYIVLSRTLASLKAMNEAMCLAKLG